MRFLIAPDQARLFCGRSQGQTLGWKACNSPWCDKFPRGSHEMQSWRRKARICKHILTARQRLDESLLGERRTDHTRTVGLVHAAGARQTGTQTAAVPVSLILCARRQSFWKHRLRTVATLPDWMIRIMEAEASGLPTRPCRVQQQGSAQIMARMAGGEHDCRCSEGCRTSARMARRRRAAFPPTIGGRDAQGAHICSCGHWALGMTPVPPRALNELSDQGDRGADRSHHAH